MKQDKQPNPLCVDIKPYNKSCDGTPLPVPAPEKTPGMEKVPPAMLKKMIDYAKELRNKHPSMTPQRAQKLTAKKFNIKLV